MKAKTCSTLKRLADILPFIHFLRPLRHAKLVQACASLCRLVQACAGLCKLEHALLFCKLLLDLELFLQSTWLSFCQGLLNSIALIFLIFLHLVFLHLLNSVGRGYEIPEHTRQIKTYKETLPFECALDHTH